MNAKAAAAPSPKLIPITTGGGAAPSTVSAAQVDRYAELDRKVKEFKQFADEHADLKKLIIKAAEGKAAAEAWVFQGVQHDLLLTAREKETEIVDKAPILKSLGAKTFLKFCSFPLKYLDDSNILPAAQRALVQTTVERTGTRKVEVVAKVKPEPARAVA